MSESAIRTVLVVGGGIVGWSAAAALRRRVPALDVAILPIAPDCNALAELIPCTLPSIVGFHGDLGLSGDDAVLRTQSSYRLGSLFSGWADGHADYVHSYARHGHALPGASFHLHWARAALGGEAPAFEAFSPAAALARNDRFAPPATEGQSAMSGYEYGLCLDLPRYRHMIRAFALHAGVREIDGSLGSVEIAADGGIAHLVLDGGDTQSADLYIDCTGPAARLRSALDQRRDDWRRWLPADRLLIAEGPPPTTTPTTLDRVTATASGWRWSAASPGRSTHGIVYAADHAGDDAAARELEAASGGAEPGMPIAIAAGSRPEAWQRNCVAIGEAATVVEPLEWCNLHLAHSAIDRLIAMLPDRDFAAVELADYNRQHVAETERVRDFIALHYAVAKRYEPFWRQAAAVELPPSLAHTLALFRERGRLPFYEEETFARDSWLAVLFGQGIIPARVDPLVEVVEPTQSAQAMAAMRAAIDAALPLSPTHAAFLGAQMRSLA